MLRIFFFALLAAASMQLGAATVFRCDMPDGSVAFSDRECSSGQSQQLDVEAQSIGGSLAPSDEYQQLQRQRDAERDRRQIQQQYRNAREAINQAPCRTFSSTQLRRLVIKHQVVVGMDKSDALRAWGSPTRVNGSQHAYHWARGGSSYFYTENGCVRTVQGGFNG